MFTVNIYTSNSQSESGKENKQKSCLYKFISW